jgi:outer membrane receptor protein involved in Fe transport
MLAALLAVPGFARAADSDAEGGPYETVVTATTPIHGSRLPRDRVPANVQTIGGEALAASHSLDLSGYVNTSLGSVTVNETQENPLEPDLQYRGFLASPVVGAPQGLSVYLDGMRLNEPFADTVSWDLIPTGAIRSVNLMPGSNALFGLNTLGGALSIETKTGFSDPGTAARLSAGSFGRRQIALEFGDSRDRLAWFAAGHVLEEDGWRAFSPSRSAGGFLSTTYATGPTFVDLALAGAATTLSGNGPAPVELLRQDRSAVFTHPDRTENQMAMALLRAERALPAASRLSGTAYGRLGRADTVNGDQRGWAACADPAQAGNVCSTDDAGNPILVTDHAGNPVPFDPAAPWNAADNHTSTRQASYGAAVQLAVEAPLAGRENHLFVGAGAGQGRIAFTADSTLARLSDTRATIGTDIVDPASPVAVDAVASNLGVYASDTFAARPDLFVVASARLNVATLSLTDRLGGGLGGDHTFSRLNPAAGISYQPLAALGVYASYSESARAPTPIELTCASPDAPCRLPNAFVSDPPLAEVVARTFEAGARGAWHGRRASLDWAAAAFRTASANDIAFISSGAVANQGYFANVGETRRQGIEAGFTGRRRVGATGGGRLEGALHYTFLDARFERPFTALSATHPDAVGGVIDVPAGARIPAVPRHIAKASAGFAAAFGLELAASVIAQSSQYFRGDEANLLAPLPGFVVVNVRAAFRIARWASLFLIVDNVLDAQYATFGVLGNPAAVLPGFTDPRFESPAPPRAFWLGLDLKY